MFTEYFAKQSHTLSEGLKANLDKRGIQLPGKDKDINIYRDLFTFFKEHLPSEFSLATGKVRGKKHLLNKNCDLLIYKKWCQNFLAMAGGYVVSDFLYAFMSLETDLTTASVITHATMTNAVKSLYKGEREFAENQVIPVFSTIFAYRSSVPIMSHRVAIQGASRERGISVNHEMDMICILNQGLIIKDWESGGGYKIVETGDDTLLWFYILLLEYLDRDGAVGINARDYIKNAKVYKEL